VPLVDCEGAVHGRERLLVASRAGGLVLLGGEDMEAVDIARADAPQGRDHADRDYGDEPRHEATGRSTRWRSRRWRRRRDRRRRRRRRTRAACRSRVAGRCRPGARPTARTAGPEGWRRGWRRGPRRTARRCGACGAWVGGGHCRLAPVRQAARLPHSDPRRGPTRRRIAPRASHESPTATNRAPRRRRWS
jgi:hypothetical protein